MYSDIFCKVYNEFGWNYYPEAFGEQLLQWMQENSFHPKTAKFLMGNTVTEKASRSVLVTGEPGRLRL